MCQDLQILMENLKSIDIQKAHQWTFQLSLSEEKQIKLYLYTPIYRFSPKDLDAPPPPQKKTFAVIILKFEYYDFNI